MSQNKIAASLNFDAGAVSRYYSGARTVPRNFHDRLLAFVREKGVEVSPEVVAELADLRDAMLAASKSPKAFEERIANAREEREGVADAAMQVSASSDVTPPLWRATPSALLKLVLTPLVPLSGPLLAGLIASVSGARRARGGSTLVSGPEFVLMFFAMVALVLVTGVVGLIKVVEVSPDRRGGGWYFVGVAVMVLLAALWALAGFAAPEVLGPLNDAGRWLERQMPAPEAGG